jgi:alkylated DNA repair dioxygenase AlkB
MPDLFANQDPEILCHEGRELLWLWHDFLRDPETCTQTLCETLPWQQSSLTLFGKTHLLPRLQSWHGDKSYSYSGRRLDPEPWTDLLQEIRRQTEEVTHHSYNSVLCNLYRNGKDHMGWHADDENALGATPWIASVSLGCARDFHLRRKGTHTTALRLSLPHNSLLLMAPQVQQHWQHAVPTRCKLAGQRLNMTFRLIV